MSTRLQKRLLVTGATGFIGRATLDPLVSRGFEIHATSRNIAAQQRAWFHAYPADLLAPGVAAALVAEIQPTHLLHLAWSPPSQSWTTLENLSWAAATLILYRTFIELVGKRAVLAGSCAEYDWSHEILCESETPSRSHSLYGSAKNSVRELIEQAAGEYRVSTAWARIFFVYGPHEPRGRLVSDVANALLNGQPARTTHGRQKRDFMHVEDVAEALVALLDGEVSGTVNIASGRCVAVREVVKRLADAAGRPDLLKLGVLPSRPDEPARLAADISRLTNEIGFRPRYSLKEGLGATFEWWRRARQAR